MAEALVAGAADAEVVGEAEAAGAADATGVALGVGAGAALDAIAGCVSELGAVWMMHAAPIVATTSAATPAANVRMAGIKRG